MDHQEVLEHAIEILSMAGVYGSEIPPVRNFSDYGALVAYAARQLPQKNLNNIPWFKDWAFAFKDLYACWDRLVAADPMLQYEPRNSTAEEFHRSNAYIRYFRAGNRTSKTQSGYAEDYWVVTGHHPYWKLPRGPYAVALVAGLPFIQYVPGVFEAKLISGEPGNILSPMFPEGGKWLNHYDPRMHVVTIACRQCAEAGAATSCRHSKSQIRLFSSEHTYEVLQGAAYNLVHFDEDLEDPRFFSEARQRTKSVRGRLILTGTPTHGEEAWEQTEIAQLFKDGLPRNLSIPGDQSSAPLVSLHSCDMYQGQVVDKEEVDKEKTLCKDEYEIRVRIYGEPLPMTNSPVFDRKIMQEMRVAFVTKPQQGWLRFLDGQEGPLRPEQLLPDSKLELQDEGAGPYRIWEEPIPGAVYIAGIDTAAGLIDRDASCASVLRLEPHGFSVKATLVAQYHGWANPADYADHLMPLLVKYNSALAIIETTGGLGVAVALRLKNDYGYWNIYREPTDHVAVQPRLDPRIGIDTNTRTKPFMVAALQGLIKERRIIIRCGATYDELARYEEVRKGKGGAVLSAPKYQGAGGSRDDRVMSLAIAAAVIYSRPDLCYAVETPKQQQDVPQMSNDMAKFHREEAQARLMESEL